MGNGRFAMYGRPHGYWGRRRCGFFFFPPFALFFGLFLLFMLFHTGLWIPLLVGGVIFWSLKRRPDMWEKRKWNDWDDEKPKHDEYI